jgi:hypothetical protein
MKTHTISLVVFAMACACSSKTAGTDAPPAAAPIVPQSLMAAHQAYLDRDFLALGDRLRDVLVDPSASRLVKENAFELLEKAYQTNQGKLPSSFKLPDGCSSMQLGYFHVETPNGPHYEVHARVLAKDASHVTRFALRRLPDETVLDGQPGNDHLIVRRDPAARAAGVEEVIINSGPIETPPDDGVVSIRLELDDGSATDGYVITRKLAWTASLDIRVPESTSDPQPVIAWRPLMPEYAGDNARGIVIHVMHREDGSVAWEYFTKKPDGPNEVRVGAGGFPDKARLAAGDYLTDVSAGEERMFGPVTLVRLTRAVRPLRVVP